jgi:hypothetical protein
LPASKRPIKRLREAEKSYDSMRGPPHVDPSYPYPHGLGVFKKPPDIVPKKWSESASRSLCVIQPMATLLSQRPSKAKFVTIRVGQVEEPLPPFGIAR